MCNENFVDIKLKDNTLDVFIIRKSILNALKLVLPNLNDKLLDLGCGKMPYKQYILENSNISSYVGLDIESALIYDDQIRPDFVWDGITMPFNDNSFRCAIATEVLEHCPDPETVLKETYRVLKSDGILFFTVPFLWNLHEVPYDEYRYTPFSIKRHLEKSGFKDIEINPTGGWHAAMAQMLGLWVRRGPISKNKRRILSKFIKPLIRWLIQLDRPKEITFKEGQMITGLTGTAKKIR